MELWIRSQDKRLLIKTSYIYISENGTDIDRLKLFFLKSEDNYLGKYKSKERALEILDEIQKIIKPQLLFKEGKIIGSIQEKIIREPAGCEIKELSSYVYEMPKE